MTLDEAFEVFRHMAPPCPQGAHIIKTLASSSALTCDFCKMTISYTGLRQFKNTIQALKQYQHPHPGPPIDPFQTISKLIDEFEEEAEACACPTLLNGHHSGCPFNKD